MPVSSPGETFPDSPDTGASSCITRAFVQLFLASDVESKVTVYASASLLHAPSPVP